jgi:hypothetical protein
LRSCSQVSRSCSQVLRAVCYPAAPDSLEFCLQQNSMNKCREFARSANSKLFRRRRNSSLAPNTRKKRPPDHLQGPHLKSLASD